MCCWIESSEIHVPRQAGTLAMCVPMTVFSSWPVIVPRFFFFWYVPFFVLRSVADKKRQKKYEKRKFILMQYCDGDCDGEGDDGDEDDSGDHGG